MKKYALFLTVLLWISINWVRGDVDQIHVSILNNNSCAQTVSLQKRRAVSCNGNFAFDWIVFQGLSLPAGYQWDYQYTSQNNSGNCGITYRLIMSGSPDVTVMPE